MPGGRFQYGHTKGSFFSITKTVDELSIVCPEGVVPENVLCEKGWKILKIQGTLDFGLVGILAMVSTALARAGISIFAISTYNTDYILVKDRDFNSAVDILRNEGHEVLY
ncbi:conserved hypothetical protein [Thermosinus carboxydivorans Nor1]|uniref:Uncharacterized protein n=1 Tax=Thermosinus carboxydivorans Nor1 TaxID=401526 RepID=A1HNN6_9FIRM|nr:ACT domain-containing protein [Thermosinus carboxydivorans]EAX48395.1 conserved hypothetical protein [Thermosinus carboxydivorans Nor1]